MQITLNTLCKKTVLPQSKTEKESFENFISYLLPEEKSPPAKDNSVKPEKDRPEEKTVDKEEPSQDLPKEETMKLTNNTSQNDRSSNEELVAVLKNHIQQQDIQLKSSNLQTEQTGISLLNEELAAKTFQSLKADTVEAKVEISALALQKIEIKPINFRSPELITSENKLPEKNETTSTNNQPSITSKENNQVKEKREIIAEVKPEPRAKLNPEKETGQLPVQTQNEPITPVRIFLTHSARANDQPILQHKILSDIQNAIQFLWQRGEDKIVIKLFPPELGRVQIELFRKDQVIEVRINTENQSVRELILSNADQLRQNLQNSGVQLRNFEVQIGNFRDFFLTSQQNNQHSTYRGRTVLPDYGPTNQSDHLLIDHPDINEKVISINGRINILI